MFRTKLSWGLVNVSRMVKMRWKKKTWKLLVVSVAIMLLLLYWIARCFDVANTGSKDISDLIFGEYVLPEPSQNVIDYISTHVNISYKVLDNFVSGQKMGGGGYHLASIAFLNTGNYTMPAVRWQIYGFFMKVVERQSYPYPNGFYINSCGLKIYHVGGSLYIFKPSGRGYVNVLPGASLVCKIKVEGFSVSRTDSMPNWYVTGSGLTPRVIANTADESLSFVEKFEDIKQYKRRADDTSHPFTAQERYNLYKWTNEMPQNYFKVIPTPLKVNVNESRRIIFDNTWVIVQSVDFITEIAQFAAIMHIQISKTQPARRYILVKKEEAVPENSDTRNVDISEAYIIRSSIDTHCIIITAKSSAAVFYAFQTLTKILYAPDALTGVDVPIQLPEFTIQDEPRYSYRGLHIDVSRNFVNKDHVKKIMYAMSMYKMNKLHLHLSDDEGWRLEIPGLPELTEVGAKRCHDLSEENCTLPMLGSGPFANTSGSGFYSVDDYRELLRHAQERHIEVIPEFDMPGHSRAAVKSIHAKSFQSNRQKNGTNIYSIIEEWDHFSYMSIQHFTDNVMNPCLKSTYNFVRKVITEVKKLHADIQPLQLYHLGGDEVADNVWSESSECHRLKNDNTDAAAKHLGYFYAEFTSKYDLMKHFVSNIDRIGLEEGLSIGAWEDAMISHKNSDTGTPFPRKDFQNNNVYVYVWRQPSKSSTPHRTKLFANLGYKVILAYGTFLYFDHPYEPDPEERGLYWAERKISIEDVWQFTPEEIILSDNELACPSSIVNQDDCFILRKPENILGMQAQLWTETVRTDEHVDFMLFPRLLAVAERAWHRASWEGNKSAEANTKKSEDWVNFINTVGHRELRHLDNLGIKYRVPPPGAIVIDGNARFRTEFPGLEVQFFSETTGKWEIVSHNMPVTKAIMIRTMSADGKRVSRVITLNANAVVSSSLYMMSNLYILTFVLNVFKTCSLLGF